MRTLLLLLSILLIPVLLLSFLAAGTLYTQKIKPNVLLNQNGDTVRFNPATGTVRMSSKSGEAR